MSLGWFWLSVVYVDVILVEFWVDGSALPFVDFDVGPSWAGLLPISGNTSETRQVGWIVST